MWGRKSRTDQFQLIALITTLPVVFPIVTAPGYDPIWFGVIVTMPVELATISPPDGVVLWLPSPLVR